MVFCKLKKKKKKKQKKKIRLEGKSWEERERERINKKLNGLNWKVGHHIHPLMLSGLITLPSRFIYCKN